MPGAIIKLPRRHLVLGADDLQEVRPLALYDKRPWWVKNDEAQSTVISMEDALAAAFERAEEIHSRCEVCHCDRQRIARKAGRTAVKTPNYHGTTTTASSRIRRDFGVNEDVVDSAIEVNAFGQIVQQTVNPGQSTVTDRLKAAGLTSGAVYNS